MTTSTSTTTIATSTDRVDPALIAGNRKSLSGYRATHFKWEVSDGVATLTLNRPDRKNPLTFDSYAELRDLFGALKYATDVHAVVLIGAGDNFCSGGDVHEIIGPLVRLKAPELLMFTRMTGDLVKAMRACPQPIVAAVDGVCAGAGAIMAMASDLRLGTARSKTAFLFNRVGLAGCDMGACAILPRLIGQGRASELLYTGRSMGGEEGERWGFFNRLVAPDALLAGGDCVGTRHRRRPDFRERHHQDHAAPGVGDDDPSGDRGRGAGAGDLHADRRFLAGVPRVRREAEATLRRKLNMQNEKGPSAGPPQAGPHPLGGSVAVLGDRGAAIPSGLAVFRGSASRVGA